MRLADVCNPHFKDEHPFLATVTVTLGLLPRAVSRVFHDTRTRFACRLRRAWALSTQDARLPTEL